MWSGHHWRLVSSLLTSHLANQASCHAASPGLTTITPKPHTQEILVTADHINMKDVYGINGVDGFKWLFNWLDRATGFRQVQPLRFIQKPLGISAGFRFESIKSNSSMALTHSAWPLSSHMFLKNICRHERADYTSPSSPNAVNSSQQPSSSDQTGRDF